MKRNKKILILLGTVFILLNIIFFVFNNGINRSSFILKINGDFTSSGAQRNYDAKLIFIDNILTEGTESYYVGQGGGCTNDCERISSCSVLNGNWVDDNGGGNCKIDYPFIPATTKTGIEKQIKLGKIIPSTKCGHLDICYEILDLSHLNDGNPGGSGGSMGHQNN